MAASRRITTIDSDEEIDMFEDANDEKVGEVNEFCYFAVQKVASIPPSAGKCLIFS